MHINFPWKFHQNVFPLTITFIVLNVSTEFVLIYRPHPVLYIDIWFWKSKLFTMSANRDSYVKVNWDNVQVYYYSFIIKQIPSKKIFTRD